MNEKPHVKIGDLYRCIDKKARRFQQLQIIENAIFNNFMIAGALNDALRKANLLGYKEHAVHVIRDIRSEEYDRVASAKKAIDNMDAGPLPDITVTTHHGPIDLTEPFMHGPFGGDS